MIRLEAIRKKFGNLEVLKGIDLNVNTGEILAIVGPSGAGKTTLLQIAGTLEKTTSGRVLYDDTDITKLNDRRLSAFRNANIGFVFQFHQLLPEFTALENTAIPAMIGGNPKSRAEKKAREILDILGLSARLNHKPAQLSGGEKQRVAIARAIINQPAVVFADEPTGSLDSRNRDEIRRIIRSLREQLGQTFVIVTHDNSIAAFSDRTITLTDGLISNIIDSHNINLSEPPFPSSDSPEDISNLIK